MKRFMFVFIFLSLLSVNLYAGINQGSSFTNSKFQEPLNGSSPGPELVPFKVAGVYIPEGFDDNDNLQVVIEGFFPDGCYKVAPASIEKKPGSFRIRANAYKYYGFCVQMVVPFQQVVDLGIHSAQKYSVYAVGQPELKDLNVQTAVNQGPDDYLYAPVKQIYVSRDPQNLSKRRILLSGEFTLSCLKMSDVKISRNDNVIVVQPIAEMDPAIKCENAMLPFEVSEQLPDVPNGRYLVHVRTLNGNSFNRVILLGNNNALVN